MQLQNLKKLKLRWGSCHQGYLLKPGSGPLDHLIANWGFSGAHWIFGSDWPRSFALCSTDVHMHSTKAMRIDWHSQPLLRVLLLKICSSKNMFHFSLSHPMISLFRWFLCDVWCWESQRASVEKIYVDRLKTILTTSRLRWGKRSKI